MDNFKLLNKWLSTSTDKLFARLPTLGSGGERYAYVDNGADVLAIAHLDTVQPLSGITSIQGDIIHAIGLDDRLGAYGITHCLPFAVDLLYTDHEEIGESTAEYFTPRKEYRYIIEIDRCGVDCVTYGRDNPRFLDGLRAVGFELGVGSFTDLCFLDSPACMVNVGTGYYRPHAKDSFFSLSEFQAGIDRITRFNQLSKRAHYVASRDISPRVRWTWSTMDDTADNAYYCCICGCECVCTVESPFCSDCV